jgi:hypothetical protein
MISYEELCQALDRFNGRRRNEAEMAALDQAGEAPAQDWAAPEAAVASDFVGGVESEAPSFSESPPEEQQASVATFGDQPPENTNEIDVDDIMIDDKPAEEED